MCLFALSLTLIATVCLAADKNHPYVPNDESSGDDNGQLSLVMKEHPEQLPPLLVSRKGWSKEEAMAFALGLALGKHCSNQKCTHTCRGDGVVMVEKECDMLKCHRYDNRGNLIVDMKILQSAISSNLEWIDGSTSYNPFSELFDVQELQNPENYANESVLCPGEVRRLFARYAKSATAMIAIDVAILRWFVHVIESKPGECRMIKVKSLILTPLCALSMSTHIRDYCTDDMLTVLTKVQSHTD